MRHLLLAAVATAAALAMPSDAPAQRGSADRVLVIYGNDRCPTSGGQEIVVCVRRSEGERYRIPPQFRQTDPLYNRSWADRAQAIEYAGAGGIQSCSPSGPGGASGCFKQMIREARQERREIANGAPADTVVGSTLAPRVSILPGGD